MKTQVVSSKKVAKDKCFSAEHYLTKRCVTHHKEEIRLEDIQRIEEDTKKHLKNLRKEKVELRKENQSTRCCTMSRSYYLCCPDTKEYVWVGQGANGTGYMETFYYAELETMESLTKFLNLTKGKVLVLKDEHDEEMEKYKEFEKG